MLNRLSRWCLEWRITADEASTRCVRAAWAPSGPLTPSQPLVLSGLEPRILFSATPIDMAALTGGDDAGAMVATVDVSDESVRSSESEITASTLAEQSSGEIIIIDASVPDLQQLLDDLSASGRDAEVFVLDAERDGVDQITEILADRSDLDSIHLVSHSEDGAIKLGNLWLGEANLDGYAGQLASWQSSLAADADILLYGCDLAADSSGQALVESISELTGADVAASSDDTGHAKYGGDWDLEYTTGEIESDVAFSNQLQQDWQHKLATITVTTFADVLDDFDSVLSLREAIIQANAGLGGDTIVLSSGTYLLTIGGNDEDAAATGDLDILKDVTITGAGASTVIDAGGLGDRIFDIRFGNADISGLKITGGSAINGGAIDTQGIIVNLTDVEIYNNSATGNGGAIYTRGTLNLDRVTIAENTANVAAGIFSANSATTTLTNVTISGNTAGSAGALYNANGTVTIINSTIANNSSGIFTGGSHTTQLKNTILDNIGVNADDTLISLGNNIDSDGTAGLGDALDGVDPLLSALADNGGDVRTHAITVASPAYNAGTTAGAPAVDGRGRGRDGSPDIGAFEFVAGGTLIVDTVNDVVDGDTTSIATLLGDKGADGKISLREAIIATNNTTGTDTITLAAGTYSLSLGGGGEDFAAGGDLDIRDHLTIIGTDPDTTIIDGGAIDRVFDVINGSTFDLSHVTVTNGNGGADAGSGMRVASGATAIMTHVKFVANLGGAIRNNGSLTLVDSTVDNNSTTGWGGGIYNQGSITLDRVTFSGNSAAKDGGGIYNFGGSSINITNSTFSGNIADRGGAIYTNQAIVITNSTFYDNTATGSGVGGIQFNGGGSATLKNTILAFNTGGNTNAPVISLGGNIDSGTTAGLTEPTDQSSTDPLLDPVLKDNGGPTLTHALLAGSTAINTGITAGAPAVDQRGTTRDGATDIGAYEYVPPPNTAPTVTAGGTLGYTEGDGAVAIAPGVTVSDATDTHLEGATVSIVVGHTSTEDVLQFSNQNGITGSYDSASGVLTLTGTATVAQYEAALRSVQYENTSANPNTTTRTVQFQVNDGAATGSASRSISVTAVADPPLANPDVAVTPEDTPVVIDVLANDGGTSKVVLSNTQPTNGTAVNNGDGTITYTPDTDYNGSDSFDYEIIDGRTSSYWQLEGDGVDSVGSRNGTVNGATTVAGFDGNGLSFDGVNDHVVISDFGYTSDFTLTFRFKVDDISGSSFQYLYSHGTPETSNDLNIYIGETGSAFSGMLLTSLHDNNDAIDPNTLNVDINSLVGDSQWHSYTLTIQSGVGAKVYVDGNLQRTSTHGGDSLNPPTDLYLGARSDLDSQRFFGGQMDSVQLINATLSSPEIAQLHIGNTMSASVNVTVTAENDAPTDIAIDNNTVSENADGAVIGNVSVTDIDVGDTHSWSVDDVRFEVVGGQLKLKAGQTLDFETEPTVNVTITVTDEGGTGLAYNEAFVINVTNLNEAPTDITLSNIDVDENAVGAIIGNVGVVDVDAGDTHTWTVDDARFEVVGGQLRLRAGQSLNFETEATVTLMITATDQGGGGIAYNEAFVITVNDLNEPPTDITLSSNTVPEQTDGAIVGTVAVVDPDAGDTHAWTVDDVRFEVVGGQLKLRAGQTLDFETEPTVNLTITATDQGGGGLAYNEAFVINVTDLNDAPTDITLSSTNVPEQTDGAIVGNVGVTDVDAGDTHTWTVDDVRFEIVGGQLKLRAGQTLDFETEPTVNLTITATDQGGGGLAYNEAFVINVTDLNEAPTDITLSNTNVDENAAGAVIGNVGVIDVDAGDTHTWTVDDVRFEVVGGQLRLRAGQSLDFETEPSVNLTITATDQGGGGLAYNEAFVITVNNLNEAPTDITLSNTNVDENAAGAVIGNVGVVDPDAGDTHSWTVDDVRFEVVGGQLRLKAGQSLDFETEPTVNVTITATDQGGGGLAYNEVFVITVNDLNEAPTDITLSNNTVDENAVGAVIGTVGVVDPDAGDTHSWTVDDVRFEVVGGQLRLKAGQSLDFETEPTVNLTITATDQGGAGIAYNEVFLITVNDLNEAPTDITLSNTNVPEQTDGAIVGTVGVVDPDAGDTHTWTVDDARFEIVGGQLKLRAGQTLDLVAEPTVNLTITVTDQGGGGLSYNEVFVLTVTNVNQAPTDISLDNTNVAENAAGAVIGNVGVVDPDAGDTHAWTVDDARFEIVGGQLRLRAGQSLDFETESTVNLTITVTDQGGTGLAYNEVFVITVNDLNEAPTDITLSSTTVPEQTDGAIIGNVGVTDPDAGDTHTWTVDDVRFEVVGGQLKLRAGQTLDFIAEPTVSLTITVTDQGGAGVSYNEVFVITVTNVNQAPTDISLDNTNVSENAAGAVIGNVGVVDPDAGDTHTWTVDDVRFEIVGGQLKLRAGQSLDFETEPTVNLTITATDQGGAGLAYNEAFVITVNNGNEAPTDVTLSGTNVDENTAGAAIGNIGIVDPDAFDFHTATVNDARFEIFGSQLRLRAGQSLNFESQPTVDVTITVRDQGGTGLAYSEVFTITVNNLNDAPTADTEGYFVIEGTTVVSSAPGVLLGDLDPDGDAITALLQSGPSFGTLVLAPDGSFTYTPDAGFTGIDAFVYIASDGSLSSAPTLVTISVTAGVAPLPPTPDDKDGDDDDPVPPIPPVSDPEPGDEPETPIVNEVGPVVPGGDTPNSAPTPRDRLVAVLPSESTEDEVFIADRGVDTGFVASAAVTFDSSIERGIESLTAEQIRNRLQAIFQVSVFDSQWQSLDTLREELLHEGKYESLVVGAAVGAAVAMSVGQAVWLLRAGYMASTLMSTMPIWRSIDPLPVLEYLEGDSAQPADNESLQTIIQQGNSEQPV